MAEPTVLLETAIPQTTPSQAVSLLINAAVGAGVLGIPRLFSDSGYLGGLLLLSCVGSIMSFTLYILSRWAEQTQSNSMGQLVARSLGPAWSLLLSVVLFLYLFGSGVAYLVILGDCFHPFVLLLSKYIGIIKSHPWFLSRQAIIAVVSSVAILPMCFAESLSAAAWISTINFYGFITVTVTLCFRSAQTIHAAEMPFDGAQPFSSISSFAQAIPIAVFGLQCHAQVVAVFNELTDEVTSRPSERLTHTASVAHQPILVDENVYDDDTNDERSEILGATSNTSNPGLLQRLVSNHSLSHLHQHGQQVEIHLNGQGSPRHRYRFSKKAKSRKLSTMTRIIMYAISITATGYAFVGVSAYLAFPTSIPSNVLNAFPAGDPVILIARGVVGILEIASYPVNHLPARLAIRDILGHISKDQQPPSGPLFVAVETLLFFIGTLAIALFVEDLGSVFTLVGGTCGAVIIFGIPGVVIVNYSWRKMEQSGGDVMKSKYFWAGMLLIIACLSLMANTVYSVAFR